MKLCSHILLVSPGLTARFEWTGYDGDDEFDHLYIEIRTGADEERFDIGPCGIFAIDRLTRFFREASLSTVGGRGHHPEAHGFSISREGDDYRIVVRSDDPARCEEFRLHSPRVEFGE